MMQEPMQSMEPDEYQVEASPELQAQYEKYIRASLGNLFSNQGRFQKMIKFIKASKKERIVETIAMITMQLFTHAEKKHGKITDDDLTESVAESIIEELLEVAMQIGVLSEAEIDEDLASAIYIKTGQMHVEKDGDNADPRDKRFLDHVKQQGQAEQQEQVPQQQEVYQ